VREARSHIKTSLVRGKGFAKDPRGYAGAAAPGGVPFPGLLRGQISPQIGTVYGLGLALPAS
jgi:hypothetical protein